MHVVCIENTRESNGTRENVVKIFSETSRTQENREHKRI